VFKGNTQATLKL